MSDNDSDKNIDDNDIILFSGISYINQKVIYDSDIYKYVGFKNYVMLSRKFPYYFKKFKECDTRNEGIGFIPGRIFLFLDKDPAIIKKDLIKTIYFDKYISKTSSLIFDNDDGNIEPDKNSFLSGLWLFISLVMVFLLLLSIYILFTSSLFKEFTLYKRNYYEIDKKYYKNI